MHDGDDIDFLARDDWLALGLADNACRSARDAPSLVGGGDGCPRPLAAPGRLQLVTLGWIAAYRLAVFVFHAASDMLHRNRFTYWCYGLETGFYLALGLGYVLRNRFAPRALALVFSPMVFGNVFMVSFLITLILLGDRGLLFEEAAQTANVGVVHFANVVVHMLTLVDFFVLLVAGYKESLRAEMQRWLLCLAARGQSLERLYQAVFILLPASYMFLYVLCWDPFDEYPTPYFNPWLLMALALVVGYGAMVWFWHVCTVANEPRLRRTRTRPLPYSKCKGPADGWGEDWE